MKVYEVGVEAFRARNLSPFFAIAHNPYLVASLFSAHGKSTIVSDAARRMKIAASSENAEL